MNAPARLILAADALMVMVHEDMFERFTQVQADTVERIASLSALLAWLMQGRSAARA